MSDFGACLGLGLELQLGVEREINQGYYYAHIKSSTIIRNESFVRYQPEGFAVRRDGHMDTGNLKDQGPHSGFDYLQGLLFAFSQ